MVKSPVIAALFLCALTIPLHKPFPPVVSETMLSWIPFYLPWCLFSDPLLTLFPQLLCCSVAKSCLTHCNPMSCSTPGFPLRHYLPEFAQTHVHWVGDAIQSSFSVTPLFFCFQSFPTSESCPMSWLFTSGGQNIQGFSFSISPCNEYSALISFRLDWFDLLAVQGTLKSLP